MFRDLLRQAPPAPRHDDRSRAPSRAPSLALLEAAFVDWVDGWARPDVLVVGGDTGSTIPLDSALVTLRSSTKPLDPAHGRLLGLAGEACVGRAAERLLHARLDPDGPRCRSFRAAGYYLIGLALLESDALRTAVDVGPGETCPAAMGR
jgi:hypothetical protein